MRHRQRFFPPAGYIPQFYGYARVSSKEQHDLNNSVPEQDRRIRAYFEMMKTSPEWNVEWAGIYAEPAAQSAFKKPFPSRPAGRELVSLLKPGDHLAVDKLDRIFRDLEDFAERRRWFREHGITLHIINFFGSSLNVDSVLGDLVLPIFAVMAEAESIRTSDRTRQAFNEKRARGLYTNSHVPFFCEWERREKGNNRIRFKDWTEKVCERIVILHDEHHVSFASIAFMLTKEKYNVNCDKVKRLYGFWKSWNERGRPDINTLDIKPFIKAWWELNPDKPSIRRRRDDVLNDPFIKATKNG